MSSTSAHDGPKVMDTTWRRRLLIIDAVLIAGLGWLLWTVYSGKQAWDEAEAAQAAAAKESNLRGFREADDFSISGERPSGDGELELETPADNE
ncbi:hypothetical protein [Engelhardtia mirabilis]|uniref:Uncharacterized protein n=1 Tax=Engelhardtia mirabilis TaxID=2528011 RepID=A0A518BIJ8_9BACT|nr:hypothetical protein Pla133_18490 [Planctomycetes bacterium Pla133]QDV01099.1 hypothetical protein Pla86_18480 [Planctomycetes bacterium Pla86]